LRGGQSGYTQQFIMSGVDGTQHWMAESVGVTRLAPDRWNLVGVVFDITENKRVEQALRENEYLLRQVLDTNPNLIMVRDQQGKLVLANSALSEFYGKTVDNIVGHTHAALHSEHGGDPRETDEWIQTDLEIVRTGKPQQLM